MGIQADVQQLEPSAHIEVFILDGTVCGAGITRFHNYVADGPITWQGQVYDPWPFQAEGFSASVDSQSRPTLTVGNMGGAISALCMDYDDLVGATLTRKRTLRKYLDAVNFSGGNPDADPGQMFPDSVWYVERKVSETQQAVSFELTSVFDLTGRALPRRQIQANKCAWITIGGYRGPYCGYMGPPVAKADDTPTALISEDKCGGRVTSCKLRFGETAELPYGGFPAASLTR